MSQATTDTFSISFTVDGCIHQEISILPEQKAKGTTPEMILKGLNDGTYVTIIGQNPRILDNELNVIATVESQSTQTENYDYIFTEEDE